MNKVVGPSLNPSAFICELTKLHVVMPWSCTYTPLLFRSCNIICLPSGISRLCYPFQLSPKRSKTTQKLPAVTLGFDRHSAAGIACCEKMVPSQQHSHVNFGRSVGHPSGRFKLACARCLGFLDCHERRDSQSVILRGTRTQFLTPPNYSKIKCLFLDVPKLNIGKL